MSQKNSTKEKKPNGDGGAGGPSVFHLIAFVMIVVIAASIAILRNYNPPKAPSQPPITFEQKMAYLESGTPLPNQQTKPEVPRWMTVLILGFVVVQVLPLLLASHKARAKELSPRDLRQIEYLTETPLFLGLLGSLLGVCMTQFISGSLAAPLAYLTTISGILLYLLGRFTISVSVPSSNDLMI
jgi:hypothetical protein